MTYCKPILEHRAKREWVTEDYIECLDKTTDPQATDNEIKIFLED